MTPDHPPTAQTLDRLALHGALNGSAKAPALILRDEQLNYDQLNLCIGQLAGWLKGQGLNPGDRIASWMAKGLVTCVLPLAAARAGLVHVPINPLLKRAQVAHILSDSGARLLIANSARLKSLEEGDVPTECAVHDEGDAHWRHGDGLTVADNPNDDPDALAAILYTSGSTGRPKGVMLSHTNLWLGALAVADYLKLQSDDRVLAVLPLSFDYGQNQLLSTWVAGGAVVPLDYLFPRDVMKAMAKYQITTLAGVPPLWVQLTELDWDDTARQHLRRVTNSGGALTEPLVRDMQACFGDADIYAMYGLTEAFRSTYLDPALLDSHPTSMGRAIPYAEIMVVNAAGERAAPNEEGELVHAGPLVAQGYWQDPDRTAKRFRPAPAFSQYGGTAVWSGDWVKRADNGLLYFVGRHDAMIKSSGNRISPLEIEDAALATGLVQEAAAFGVADDRLGHAIHLVVRAKAGEADDEALHKALKSALPNFMMPHHAHWRAEMPRNPNGKLDRTALQNWVEVQA